jgi:aconitate decarboxylase
LTATSGTGTALAPTAALAGFCADLRIEAIPLATRRQVILAIIDSVGCGLAGASTPEGHLIGSGARRWGPGVQAAIWDGLGTATATAAVLANATMVQALTFDDIHLGSGVHPGAVTTPVAFALAEMLPDLSGSEFLTAIVAGYEVGIRVGLSVMPTARLRGFHPVGICGPLAAASTAARLCHLDADASLHALGTAGSLGAGLMAAQFDSMVQRLHAGRAAEAGLMAVDLSAAGFRGIRDLLEAPYGGFCGAFAGPGEPDLAVTQLGQRFYAGDTTLRQHSSAASCTTSIDAGLRLMREQRLEPRQIQAATVFVSEFVHHHAGWRYEPREIITAQMNIQFGLAAAILHGRAGPDEYRAERLAAPEILALVDRIAVRADPSLDAAGAEARYASRVRFDLVDGRQAECLVLSPRGSPADPLSESEVLAKFHHLVDRSLGETAAQRLVGLLLDLEQLQTMAGVLAILGRASQSPRNTRPAASRRSPPARAPGWSTLAGPTDSADSGGTHAGC